MGIRAICLNLLENYLIDRVQILQVNGLKSGMRKVNVGVPQGSILGPLLFLIFINDLLKSQTNLVAYADNIALYTSEDDWNNSSYARNLILNAIYSWLFRNTE